NARQAILRRAGRGPYGPALDPRRLGHRWQGARRRGRGGARARALLPRGMTVQPETETGTDTSRRGHAPVFRRILRKLSSEQLMGERDYGMDPDAPRGLARQVRGNGGEGVVVAVVVVGGNFYRGLAAAAEGGM